MDEELRVGDIVRLKSGGPEMTIEYIGKFAIKDGAKCVWFDGKKRHEDIFLRFQPSALSKDQAHEPCSRFPF